MRERGRRRRLAEFVRKLSGLPGDLLQVGAPARPVLRPLQRELALGEGEQRR
ncbi:hypothetical protein OCH7691_01146 [Oceanibacterium hippocampi]|uniref:Uncharacterized protein n=1 Tax=Oceanibacterium hippocampi TaxID=745714 RepID=A0A1Y5S396_9PROT|nr:hypothetical protein [Oceanibacterium hippocampi]SLN31733.1 hypothetical protein OCH7691_01146 [Oceanibacterium hippocampi]